MILTETDCDKINTMGSSAEQIYSQMKLLKKGIIYINLDRPCTINDGIRLLTDDGIKELVCFYDENIGENSLVKFVPASGAATRMFKGLISFNSKYARIEKKKITKAAHEQDKSAVQMIKFMDCIKQFAFFDDLKSKMAEDGLSIDGLIEKGEFKEILEYLLTQKGLNYTNIPKGLLKFHKYSSKSRTAIEEHLVEAAGYAREQSGFCNIHFTVSSEHREKIESFLQSVCSYYEEILSVKYNISFSVQGKATDTIAVDVKNRPFRLNDGTILFRPGGHGALIENLNKIKEDIIYIKNIDNVIPDRLKKETFKWKKVLCGSLIKTRKKIFSCLKILNSTKADESLLNEVYEFIKTELNIYIKGYENFKPGKKQKRLMDKLNRPMRVCGMVQNIKEPGGGPFWVKAADGELSIQIVETAQIDTDSDVQQVIFTKSTHFNPVDIVCSITDWEGNRFNLNHFVNHETAFISDKSKNGQSLKALELPGLWNGAMWDWITIFVEVPQITFNPVKTVTDLLREEHLEEGKTMGLRNGGEINSQF